MNLKCLQGNSKQKIFKSFRKCSDMGRRRVVLHVMHVKQPSPDSDHETIKSHCVKSCHLSLGPMKGGQSVECQGHIFGNVTCRLENGSVECRLYIL